MATAVAMDIDADFGDTGIDATAGYGGERSPGKHLVVLDGDEAAVCQVRFVPFFPGGGAGLEGSMAGSQTGFVDGLDGGPVFGQQRDDVHAFRFTCLR